MTSEVATVPAVALRKPESDPRVNELETVRLVVVAFVATRLVVVALVAVKPTMLAIDVLSVLITALARLPKAA